MIELLKLMDPEFLIPAEDTAKVLEFWHRLAALSEDDEIRVGPATLSALGALVSDPPDIGNLPIAEFWKIVGKFSQRGLPLSEHARPVCVRHLDSRYSPYMGQADNSARLLKDLSSTGNSGYVALRTARECWSSTNDRVCSACESSGVIEVVGDSLHLKGDEVYASAWRKVFLDHFTTELRALERFAPQLFPSICFSSTAWNGINSLRGAPQNLLVQVVNHLTILNDSAARIWTERTATHERQAAMAALGANCSRESSNTHKNKNAMSSRKFDFGGEVRECEWHTKIERHRNRIYFDVSEESVWVGTIIDHLPT